MKHYLLLLVLIIAASSTTAQQGSGLSIHIEEITVYRDNQYDMDGRIFYAVNASGSIDNPTDQPIEFTHANLCRFTLNVTSYHDNATGYFPLACPEAIELVTFEPGTTTFSAFGGILLAEEVSKLPNTNYTVFVNLNSYQKDVVAYNYGASFGVVEHEVVDINYDLLDFHNNDPNIGLSGPLNYPFLAFFTLPAFLSFYRLKQR